MKTKLLALVATLGMVASASAVKINNNLSINGFIDGSYQSLENDANIADSQSLSVDEVELDFIVNVGNIAGEIHLDAGTNNGSVFNDRDGIEVEQAHMTYSLDNGVSFTFGQFGSALGFEREDPAGLYTFSRAYDNDSNNDTNVTSADRVFNLGDVDGYAYEGLRIGYSVDNFSFAASIQSEAGDSRDIETNDLDIEFSFAYTGFAGATIGGGYRYDNEDNTSNEVDVLNLHISKQFGKLLLAGEYIASESDNQDKDGYMILGDYDFNDKAGVALRFSNNEQEGTRGDYEKLTIAPNYAITESLGAILEYSDIEDNTVSSELIAVELTYTF
jgi:hypothetical protein